MQAILIVGEGERAEQMARELADAGYEVEVRSFAEMPEGLAMGDAAAIVVEVSAEGEIQEIADSAGRGAEKRPVLAVLPEEMLASRGHRSRPSTTSPSFRCGRASWRRACVACSAATASPIRRTCCVRAPSPSTRQGTGCSSTARSWS